MHENILYKTGKRRIGGGFIEYSTKTLFYGRFSYICNEMTQNIMQTTPIFDKRRALQSILYVANKLERRDFHKIFKVLYFADMEHLNKYGRPITGDTYIAMEYGPVPSAIYDMFKAVRGDGYQWEDINTLKKDIRVRDRYYVEPLHDADTRMLSASDIEILDWALSKYGKLSWDEIIQKSHAYAWKNTDLNDKISIESMLKEKGADDGYIDYITTSINLQKACFR